MAKFVNPTKVITGPDTRWSYCNAWEAKAINGGTPKFSVSLIIPKSDTKTISKVKAAIQAAYEEGASKLKGSGKSVPSLKAIKTPLRDGDLERPDDEAYANSYFVNANSASAPGIVDADRQPIIDHSEVYSGVYNTVYYVINNNAGYTGDLEIALITTDFATEILGEIQDTKGVLVERNDAETAQFALLFEFNGDKNHIRHVLYCCSASRPKTESSTTEESTEVKTETLSLKASALPDGLVKSKTCENTDETTYNNWYKSVYIPTFAAVKTTAAKTS